MIDLAALPGMDVAARADLVRSRFDAMEVDALAVTNLTNVRWLTGFTGSNGAVLVTSDSLSLFTDGRYADQAPTQLAAAGVSAELEIGTDVVAAIDRAAGEGVRLGLEADHATWQVQQRLDTAGRSLVPVVGELVELRSRKDVGEIARIRAAAAIADETLAEVAPTMADRPTEREIALALDGGMRRRGATGAAYETIVASGPNGALPHARPTDRVIEAGDLIVIDVGALVDGYRSDMTRTFVIGQPTTEQDRQLEVVRESQAAGAATVAAGVAATEVDAACRAVIAEAGWEDRFTHGTGHGVGLDIHEQPRLNRISRDTLQAGQLVTVEPGVYLPGRGGVRWEDLLLVTDSGADCLSGAPKEPVIA
ncbi:MAG: aminopeptidase P family protein [Actinomycetota bacterium]